MTIEPTVYVVDDDQAVRDSLRWMITSVDLPVKTFASAREFLDAFDPDWRGCLLLDIRMPEMSGLELMRQFTVKFTYLPIIIITGHGDVEMAVDAMKLGAFDFIEKPFKNQPLLDLVQKAIKEAIRISKDYKEKSAVQLQLATLTEREHDVLKQILAGEINKSIAKKLNISEKTVEVHRANLMRKMKAKSLTHLIKMCLASDQYGLHNKTQH